MPKISFLTVIGPLTIAEEGGAVRSILFMDDGSEGHSDLLDEASAQVRAFLDGRLRRFDLPILYDGGEFFMRAWDAMLRIPYGEAQTYGDIASKAGYPRAARAVGMACNRNPLPLIIPCHRVVGANGWIGGFGGGLDIKRKLLEIEGTSRPDFPLAF
ncbi:MAG: methylated-DNA--[protein]-cysteine S-methyltransferase [Rickettsiales bacterium]|jgi:methylated-DNA-[protein]-cysteine S-methyltransferase|nr:methylated-DNA--[protein]-cysteine S-methyltransferase [Rickettsiales bacterium]